MTTTPFLMPPILKNAAGVLRRVGFEFEYAGLDVAASAEVVRRIFNGTADTARPPSIQQSLKTDLGDFTIEIDSSLVKNRRYEVALRAFGISPEKWNTTPLEKLLVGVLSVWVPYEISTPPIPLDQLSRLDDLRAALYEEGAKGTRASIRYAFGMHINPELPDESPESIRNHLRAFLLLLPWLRIRVDVDVTRQVMPFINPFPSQYTRKLLADRAPIDADRLIDDYLAYNPTRNRPLDLLPVLAHLDYDRVLAKVEDPHLIKPRPAYHYRLPNCLIDEPNWTIAREWNTWVAVEQLAADADRLAAMTVDYLEADEHSIRPFIDKWPGVLEGYVGQLPG